MPINTSYYFSRYPHVWGWATWRRAWQHFDVEMKQWQESADKRQFLDKFRNWNERNFWRYQWSRVVRGEVDTWDFQWVFTCLIHHGLSISPDRNLVSNIGAGTQATNTERKQLIHAIPTHAMSFPLQHCPHIVPYERADSIAVKGAILNPSSGNVLIDSMRSFAKRILWFIRR